MSKSNNLGKIVATVGTVGVVSLLLSGAFFAFYKSFNVYLDNFIASVIDILRDYGVYLSVGEFWLILGVILVFLMVIIAISGD